MSKEPKEKKEKLTLSENENPDFSLLGADQKKALTEKAREKARKIAEEDAADAYYEKELQKAQKQELSRRGLLGHEEIVEHTINLAPNADHIRLNGTVYQHGTTYRFTKDVLDVIRDQEWQGWKQEAVRKGERDNEFGLSSRNKRVSARM
jgi:hypothetical protein